MRTPVVVCLVAVMLVGCPGVSHSRDKTAPRKNTPAAKAPAPKTPQTTMTVAGMTVPIPTDADGPLVVVATLVCGDKINYMLEYNEIMGGALKEMPKTRYSCIATALVQLCLAIEADRAQQRGSKPEHFIKAAGLVSPHRSRICGTITNAEAAYFELLPTFLPVDVPMQ